MHANLDALLTATYVLIDDFLPKRPRGRGRPPEISDAEVMTLLVAQALLQIPDDRRFIETARRRLGHLFPYLPEQPRLLQAGACAHTPDRAGDQLPRLRLAVLL